MNIQDSADIKDKLRYETPEEASSQETTPHGWEARAW